MKFKFFLLTFYLLVSTSSHIQAQFSLRVLNPENWSDGQSTIESAAFTIHPSGIYMEVGMYLTFSAREAQHEGWIFDNNTWHKDTFNFDTLSIDLESILRFNLPTGSMVTDSWLWINEDVVQADIDNRWAATRIYEEIVGYRLDPSLLTKDNWSWRGSIEDDQYTLRVYPLQADSTRKVKITYLVPGNWRNGAVSIPLPVNILKASKIPVDNISVRCFLNNSFSNPQIVDHADKVFTSANDETLGESYQLTLSNEDIENGIDISFKVPMQNGIFLSNYQVAGEDYYGLVMLPKEALFEGDPPPKKVAVLLDYDSTATTISKERLLESLKEQLIENLTDKDYFNLVFAAQNGIEWISGSWLKADEQTIRITFNLIEEAYNLSDESYLPELIDKGLTYIKNNNNDGVLLLLSCAQQYHMEGTAKAYMETINSRLTEISSAFHIVDYHNKDQKGSYYYFPIDVLPPDYTRKYYIGNEYFYTLLQQQTTGSIHVIREERNLTNLLSSGLAAINPVQEITELSISKTSGRCFNEFSLPTKQIFNNPKSTLLQVGKCLGDFPYTIDISGRTAGGEILQRQIILEEDRINKGIENHQISWAGNYIYELEQNRPFGTLTQKIIREIMEWSINYRVLSLYTAFLALEPALGGFICDACEEGVSLTHPVVELPENAINDSENNVDLPNVTFEINTRGEEVSWIPPTGDSVLVTATHDFNSSTAIEIMATPNPFTVGSTISVKLDEILINEPITLNILDMNGRQVKSFVKERWNKTRELQFYWDGTDFQQQRLNAGMYIIHINTAKRQFTSKVILVE